MARAKVDWDAAPKTGIIVVANLDHIPKGGAKDLELWAICGNQPPVAAGLFWTDANGHGVGTIKLEKEITCIDKFAETIEPQGGVPSATGPMVLIGP